MIRRLVLPLVLLPLAAALAGEEADLSFRTFDLSALTAPRVPRFGPPLGAFPSRDLRGDSPELAGGDEPERFIDPDTVLELILKTVEPASWDEGGSIELCGERLLVTNRGPVIDEVEKLLGEVQEAASRRILFSVKVLALPGGSYRKAAADPRVAAKEGALLESGSTEGYPGIRTSIKVTNRVRYVSDYDVEIAQTSSIADPIVAAGEEGLSIDLVGNPTLGGDRVLVQALVRRGTFDRPIRKLDLRDGEGRLGTVDLPLFRQVAAFTTDLVATGETIALPFATADRTFLVLITPEVLGRGGGRLLDVGALTRPPLRYTVGSPPGEDEDLLPLLAPAIGAGESDPPLGGGEGLLELLVNHEDPEYWEEEGRIDMVGTVGTSFFAVRAKDEVMAGVRRFLEERERELLRIVDLDLRVYSQEGEVVPGAGKPFDAGKARLLRAGRVSARAGGTALLVAGNTMNYVADYDVEVAQEAQIPDPIVAQSFEGLAANLSPRLSPDGRRVRLEVGLLFAARTLAKDPEVTGAKFLGVIDGVSEKRTVLNETVEFPLGGETVIDAGPDPSSPGRLAIVIRATAR